MKRIQVLVIMILLSSLVLVLLYSTLTSERTFSHKALAQDLTETQTLRAHAPTAAADDGDDDDDDAVPTHPSKQDRVTSFLNVIDISVPASFRKDIPHNRAYWNRLLHANLRQLDQGPYYIPTRGGGWSHCKEMNDGHLKTNVNDFTSYTDTYRDYLRGMNCRYPPVLIDQPNKCISAGKPFLLFAIKSTLANFEKRQAVRETWGKEGLYEDGLSVSTLFLLGSSSLNDPDLKPLLQFEAKHYGDVLQWDFHESLFNLTIKLNAFLKWSAVNCPGASFVFSGDDDVFVNTPAILRYLQSLEPVKASQSYIGQVIADAGPHRDPKNKYYIPLSFYDGPYPPYTGGGGFVYSGALLQPLYKASRILPLFPIDDVYIGMCFKMLGISPDKHEGFRTFDVKTEDRYNMCVQKELILVHQRSPQQIKMLWTGIHSPLLMC
ncbi:N-acetyllactosaminide beta-1,3-N-acetylglucosaminyltransferase 2 [Lampris incognitus]|uniref:N-acetyllactosaminide beta-1,3-N-acetylglucosaminyltransferase 2 n=1 Tax=Lampris incognitus TaxID=2546036 RepID=UPI0024B4C5E2|nr:N-acetyllactosaminide beta-1,3-N-acetylglucosaminyltransferase 2 [Lampris incognitus]